MWIPKAIGHAFVSSVTLCVIAGCSGGSPQIAQTPLGQNRLLGRLGAPVSGHSVMMPSFFSPDAKGKPLIFVSDESGYVVDIYLQRGKNRKVGQIAGFAFPQGIATDTSGDVYVADSDPATDVPVYAPPYSGAPKLNFG